MKRIIILIIILIIDNLTFAQVVTICRPKELQYWTGRVDSYQKIDDGIIVGKATLNIHRSWIKFDLTNIPDNAVISQVDLRFYVDVASLNPTTFSIKISTLSVDPVSASYGSLRSDIISNSKVLCTTCGETIGYKELTNLTTLNSEVQSSLGQNWIALGLFEDNEDSDNCHINGYSGYGPQLSVYYTVPITHDITITNGQVVQSVPLYPGGQIDVSCTQNYSGNSTSTVYPKVGYYLSSNSTCSTSCVYLGEDVSSLSATNTAEHESATLTIPLNTIPGNYFVCMIADYENIINESNELNNAINAQITVNSPPPTAEIIDFVVPTGLKARETNQTVKVTIQNNGDISRSFWVGLSFANQFAAGESWPVNWYDIYPQESQVISPGSTDVITFNIRIPVNWIASQYYATTAIWDDFDEDNFIMVGLPSQGSSQFDIPFDRLTWHPEFTDKPDVGKSSFYLSTFDSPISLESIFGQLVTEFSNGALDELYQLHGFKPLFFVSAKTQYNFFVNGFPINISGGGALFFDLADLCEYTPEGKDSWTTVWVASKIGAISFDLTKSIDEIKPGLSFPLDAGIILKQFDYNKRGIADLRLDRLEYGNFSVRGLSITAFSYEYGGNLKFLNIKTGGSFQRGVKFAAADATNYLFKFEINTSYLKYALRLSDLTLSFQNPSDYVDKFLKIIEGYQDTPTIFKKFTYDDGYWEIQNGIPERNLSMVETDGYWMNSKNCFKINVPENVSKLTISTREGIGVPTDGFGDLRLFWRRDHPVFENNEFVFDGWSDDNIGSVIEDCVINNPPAGIYYIALPTYGNITDRYENVTLLANYEVNDHVITVTSPNGGETWQVSNNQNITWTSNGTSGNVRIEYSTNNGSSWTNIITSTPDDGSHPWTIPNYPSTICFVRISDTDGNPTDQSNSVFTITAINNPPNKPQLLTPGNGTSLSSAFNLTWQCTDPDPGELLNYTLRVRRKGTSTWDTESVGTQTSYPVLGWSDSDSGTYEWSLVASDGEAQSTSDIWEFTLLKPTLSITPGNQNVSSNAGSTTFIITAGTNWSISDDASWLSISPISGTGNGTLTATYTANTSTATRVGTITVVGTGVGSQVVTVTQNGINDTRLIASYSSVEPVIDGNIVSSEWPTANKYDIVFSRIDGLSTSNGSLYLQHDGSYLYFGIKTFINNGWDVYMSIRIDGNNDNILSGSLSEPHTDINIECPAPGGWSGYIRYDYLNGVSGNPIPPASGTGMSSYGSSNVSYEFKIKIADLNLSAGKTIGFYLFNLTDAIVDHGYFFPNNSTSTNPASWGEIKIDFPTNIVDLANRYSIAIYPNPAKDKLVIELNLDEAKEVGIEIINFTGTSVFKEKDEAVQGNFQKEINLSGMARGFYFVKMVIGGYQSVYKVIIE